MIRSRTGTPVDRVYNSGTIRCKLGATGFIKGFDGSANFAGRFAPALVASADAPQPIRVYRDRTETLIAWVARVRGP